MSGRFTKTPGRVGSLASKTRGVAAFFSNPAAPIIACWRPIDGFKSGNVINRDYSTQLEVIDFCRGWGILTLSLPEAEIFIMSGIDLQIFTREGATGRERETKQEWVELHRGQFGYTNKTLWIARLAEEFFNPDNSGAFGEEAETVDFDFLTGREGGIGIVSNSRAEVWAGEHRLIGINRPIVTEKGVILAPTQAVNPGGRAEIFFSQPGQSIELNIIVDEEIVKQVKIASVANE